MMTGMWSPRWIQRNSRDFAALLLLVVFPLVHITFTRGLPATLLLALIVLAVGGLLVFVTFNSREPLSAARPSVPFLVSFGVLVAFIALSGFWAPDPGDALRDSLMMLIVPSGAAVLAYGLQRTILTSAFSMLLFGLLGASLLLLLDLTYTTSLYDLFSSSARLYDLNRVTSWLAVSAVVLWPAMMAKQVRPIFALPVLVLAGIAIFMGEGQAAQLAFVVAILVGLVAMVLPRLSVWLVFGGAALLLVVFPYIAPPVFTFLEGLSNAFLEAAHAEHRLVIWQAYASWVGETPFWGFGANADALMGERGSAVGAVLEAAGYDGRVTSPHNVLLEWHVNFGLMGSLLAAAAILIGARDVAAMKKPRLIGFTMVFAAAFTASVTATEFFQGWWIATILYGFMLTLLLGKPHLTPGFGENAENPVVDGPSAA